jgi:hypothetical protein
MAQNATILACCELATLDRLGALSEKAHRKSARRQHRIYGGTQ